MIPLHHRTLSTQSGSDLERKLSLAMQVAPERSSSFRIRGLLNQAGLRATRQRTALTALLFSHGDRHVTAETLHEEAVRAHMPMSLATVYNTLNQLTDAGLLRQIGVDGSKSFFDTNTSEHHHYFLECEDVLLDIPDGDALLERLPPIPQGFQVTHVAVVVRLRRRPD